MPCRSSRVGSSGLGAALASRVVADDVVAARDAAEEVRVLRVDARVEQRDRHAAPVEPGRLTSGRLADARREPPFSISVEEIEAGYATRTG